jgi:hypothetical protein
MNTKQNANPELDPDLGMNTKHYSYNLLNLKMEWRVFHCIHANLPNSAHYTMHVEENVFTHTNYTRKY